MNKELNEEFSSPVAEIKRSAVSLDNAVKSPEERSAILRSQITNGAQEIFERCQELESVEGVAWLAPMQDAQQSMGFLEAFTDNELLRIRHVVRMVVSDLWKMPLTNEWIQVRKMEYIKAIFPSLSSSSKSGNFIFQYARDIPTPIFVLMFQAQKLKDTELVAKMNLHYKLGRALN